MTKIFVRLIKDGRLTLEQVPQRWREQVAALIGGE